MEYFIDGDPSVRRIQCEYCRKVIYTQTRNRKYCSFQTCGHKMLNLRKSLKKRVERGKYTCACCGKQFLPIRADARYCSNACRQKDYRHRKTAAHTSLCGTWQSLSSSLSTLAFIPYFGASHSGKYQNTVTLNCSLPNPQSGNWGCHLKSNYQNGNLISSVAEPPEFSFW